MTPEQARELTYEAALQLLDERLRELEEGDLTLEGALAAAEDATTYLRVCQARLEEAKRKIEVRAEPPPATAAEEETTPPAGLPEPSEPVEDTLL
ncbi:MAG: exodeoxyribonuclease VII small subunit [Candidatus Dormibacteraceae bacterium]